MVSENKKQKQAIKGLTSKDLADIKEKIEREDPNVKINWITSDDEEQAKKDRDNPKRQLTHNDLITEEYIHFDSGRHVMDKPETWKNKFHYGVLRLKNDHPTRILQNAKVRFEYRYHSFQLNTPNMNFESPPPVNKPTEYTVKKKSHSFIDKYFTSKEAFDKFHFKGDAKQDIDHGVVKSETMHIGNVFPKAERFLIFKSFGWTNRVQFLGDVDGK